MRQTIQWNHMWAFTKMADAAPTEMPGKWDFVNLPHTWNGLDGQDGGDDYYRGTCWYAKELKKADLPEADRYYLEFEGTNSSAVLYIDGKEIARHDGGYSTWRADITDALQASSLVAVAVDNAPSKTVYPQNADFTFYGGIYRDVSILAVSNTHFDLDSWGGCGLQVTPKTDGLKAGEKAQVDVKTWVKCPAGEIRVRILDENDAVVAEGAAAAAEETEFTLFIDGVRLWNGVKDPYRYHLEACICAEDGEVLDQAGLSFGVRSFSIDPEKGFFLNGEAYPLRGVARHQDRWEKGNALSLEDQVEDILLIREMGANTIRLAHYQHSQAFYDLCDAYGIVVWAEIPYISQHMPGGRENTITQMKELITQNHHHPSIVVWGLSNEITMGGFSDDLTENHTILNDLVHRMDPTRPTVMAYIGSCLESEQIVFLPDVISYNLYLGWYEGKAEDTGVRLDAVHALHPDQPLGLSEYGCEALDWHTDNPRRGDYTEEYQALYHESLIRQIQARPYLWATHVWNMFDFGADRRAEGGGKGQNRKGLVTFDRSYKKDSFYAYKAWLSDEPFVHIAGKRYVYRHEAETEVKVYSNQPSVELFVNGESVGVNSEEDLFFHFRIPNEGVTSLRAVAGDCEDTAVIERVSEPYEPYQMKDPGIVLNWFDITEVKGHFNLNDTIGDIMKVPEAADALYALLGPALPDRNEKEHKGLYNLLITLTVLRLANAEASGSFGHKMEITKEDLLNLNAKLNAVEKPQE